MEVLSKERFVEMSLNYLKNKKELKRKGNKDADAFTSMTINKIKRRLNR